MKRRRQKVDRKRKKQRGQRKIRKQKGRKKERGVTKCEKEMIEFERKT
jgi:hypothetical protein